LQKLAQDIAVCDQGPRTQNFEYPSPIC